MSEKIYGFGHDVPAEENQVKKFLDAEGVKYLWSKINMQDYPNNETLMNVIEAIDETKADKSELFSGSWNDLSDKPFYENNEQILLFKNVVTDNYQDLGITNLKDFYITIGDVTYYFNDLPWAWGKDYNSDIDYNCYGNTSLLTSFNSSVTIENPVGENLPFAIYAQSVEWYQGNFELITQENNISVSIYKQNNIIKQLDEKFIPSNIARVSDIPKELTEDEVLQILIECEVINPGTDENGNIIIDADNTIISI